MKIKTFRDLLVWQKSMGLVTGIYQVTRNFPVSEMYGLTNQIRRSAVSIPSNIAEGYAGIPPVNTGVSYKSLKDRYTSWKRKLK